MNSRVSAATALIVLAALAPSFATSPALAREMKTPVQPPVWTGHPSAEQVAKQVDDRIAKARTLVAKVLEVKGKRTVDNTLQTLDDAYLEMDAASALSGLVEQTHPDSALRAAAEAASRRVSAYFTELSLHRGLYDAIAAMDLNGADDETRHYVTRQLRDYRLNGVDRDEETRKQVTQLRK
jgi:thimet oligopeptidase